MFSDSAKKSPHLPADRQASTPLSVTTHTMTKQKKFCSLVGVLLNADFTPILKFIPFGIAIIILIFYGEYRLIKYFLKLEAEKDKVSVSIFIANSLSAVAGIKLSFSGNLSFNEYCLAAFGISVVTETIINVLFLKKHASILQITKATFLANLITNVFASLIIGVSLFGK